METVHFETKAFLNWLAQDAANEAKVIKEAPISTSLLRMLKHGYVPPSARTIKAILGVMADGQNEGAGTKAAVG